MFASFFFFTPCCPSVQRVRGVVGLGPSPPSAQYGDTASFVRERLFSARSQSTGGVQAKRAPIGRVSQIHVQKGSQWKVCGEKCVEYLDLIAPPPLTPFFSSLITSSSSTSSTMSGPNPKGMCRFCLPDSPDAPAKTAPSSAMAPHNHP